MSDGDMSVEESYYSRVAGHLWQWSFRRSILAGLR